MPDNPLIQKLDTYRRKLIANGRYKGQAFAVSEIMDGCTRLAKQYLVSAGEMPAPQPRDESYVSDEEIDAFLIRIGRPFLKTTPRLNDKRTKEQAARDLGNSVMEMYLGVPPKDIQDPDAPGDVTDAQKQDILDELVCGYDEKAATRWDALKVSLDALLAKFTIKRRE